eukprot:CAMPEP_0178434138 /NCGR_PEP_ID=MMETSP0689_2-20121128/33269_1 /TAXON_ID=160604 /ORGANISM="Amphidinium massartii, Strain CS-259" /LENGTH=65 /DNA_ID=CAMNT_0020056193 /DNA_START=43 /DNA_END=237 /DNA_ORIENTATION=-
MGAAVTGMAAVIGMAGAGMAVIVMTGATAGCCKMSGMPSLFMSGPVTVIIGAEGIIGARGAAAIN